MLIEKGLSVNDVNQDGDPLLFTAVEKGNISYHNHL